MRQSLKMFARERFLARILLAGLLTMKTSVEGSKETCPSAAIVDLTGEDRDDSGSINKTGIIFARNSTWEKNGTTFGCPCDFKKCLPFCCPAGYALSENGCAKDEFSPNFTIREQTNKHFHAFFGDPCRLSLKHPAAAWWRKPYNSPEDALFDVKNRVYPSSRLFCLIRGTNSSRYWLGVCDYPNYTSLGIWSVGCMTVSLLFGVATFFVYSVTPELKNLQGSIFRCYLGSYIGCMFLFTFIMLLIEISRPGPMIYKIIVPGLHYFGLACMFWLNVMSFDIWQKFRTFQSNQDVNMKKVNEAKFIRYSIYAWISSAVPVIVTWSVIIWKPSITFDIKTFAAYSAFSPVVCIAICNTILFTLTSFKIKQRKKETQHMVGGVNKHQKENEQWFNLYVKLFLIMGGPIIIWAVALTWNNEIFFRCALMVEVLQAILIFLIFVWKDDVKKSFGKRFNEILRSLRSRLQHVSTPTTEG